MSRRRRSLTPHIFSLPRRSTNLTKISQSSSIVSKSFKGPLPPPGMLEQYEQIIPGCGREFLDMVKKEQVHEHKMARSQQRIAVFKPTLGFLLIFSAIAGGIYLVLNDKEIAGFGAFFSGLATLTAAFIWGKIKPSTSESSLQSPSWSLYSLISLSESFLPQSLSVKDFNKKARAASFQTRHESGWDQ